MWSWARDEKLISLFKKINPLEALFFICFILLTVLVPFLFSWNLGKINVLTDFIVSYNKYYDTLWWAGFAVLFLSHIDFFYPFNINFSTSLSDFKSVDKKIYIFLATSIFVYTGVLLLYPQALPELIGIVNSIIVSTNVFYATLEILQEEILYRLLFYYSLNKFLGRNVAFFATVFCFAIYHNSSWIHPIAVLPAGISLSIVTILTGSIAPGIALHMFLNLIAYIAVIIYSSI